VDLLGIGSLVMTASTIGVGSRKEGKAERPGASKEILMLHEAQAEKSGVMRISRIRTVTAR
jgi:hypothetical protein